MSINSKKQIVITIDGPAGSGKSTVASQLARKLNITYLDTGAMYRALTLAALQKNIPLDNTRALVDMAKKCRINFQNIDDTAGDKQLVFLDDNDVTAQIRSWQVTENAHFIADKPQLREILVHQQRQIAQNTSIVTEGRDQGTVVFPHADFKFFLDASPACRAQRRYLQLKQQQPDSDISYERILAAQLQRDQRDSSRSVAPLKPAPDAVVIDTSDMTIEQVVEKLYHLVRS